jgi:aminoglycoside phosphotransferase (APT) family kinase protein
VAEPWTAEVVVDVDLARSLIESQFPDLAPARVEPLGVGWDNTVYVVDRTWVFRFPRRKVALPLNERELRLLPAVAPRVPLPVPVPTRIGRATDAFPWPFAGHRFLVGRSASVAGLDDARRAAMAGPLARFLAALHAFPVETARALGAKPDDIGKLDVRRRAPPTRAALVELRDAGAFDGDVLRGLDRALDVAPRTDFAARFVHGDLYARHVLVDDAGAACGVIDWGDCHLGDVAVDLSVAHHMLPPSAHDAFRRAYGSFDGVAIDDATWRLAKFRAVVHATACLRYARDVGDVAADMGREAALTLRWCATT